MLLVIKDVYKYLYRKFLINGIFMNLYNFFLKCITEIYQDIKDRKVIKEFGNQEKNIKFFSSHDILSKNFMGKN